MNAIATVLVALLLHLGGAGLDVSSSATIARYSRSLRASSWTVITVDGHRDSWVLEDKDRRVLVQRMREADRVYTVVADDPSSLGVVSFADARIRFTASDSRGSGVIPLVAVHAAWNERPAEDLRETAEEDAEADTGDGSNLSGEHAPAASTSENGGPVNGVGNADAVIHYRWEPGEITAAVPIRSELFVLRY